ncbi:hypothetical protein ACNKHQ_02055 [Shigella flexneri]
MPNTQALALVDSTRNLRLLPKESLPKLCDEGCRYLLDGVEPFSGHFASGLDGRAHRGAALRL